MNIIDLFSGAGGFSLGAHMAGFNIILAIDNDDVLTSSYSINFSQVPMLLADATAITKSDLLAYAGGARVHGVIGGPPCQAFSVIGRSRVDDPRRNLVYHFFRLVSEIKPIFFVMENVPGLAFAAHSPPLHDGLNSVHPHYTI